jgi:YD repeat-containing protein
VPHASQIATETRNNSSYVWTGGVNVARNYTVNGLNQYLSAGPASFGYDANGNLTSDGTSAYIYDAENRLVSSSASGGTTLSYDPLGRLWKIWSQQTGTTSFVYEGDHVSAEYDWSGTMLRRYFWGPGADEPIVAENQGPLRRAAFVVEQVERLTRAERADVLELQAREIDGLASRSHARCAFGSCERANLFRCRAGIA